MKKIYALLTLSVLLSCFCGCSNQDNRDRDHRGNKNEGGCR